MLTVYTINDAEKWDDIVKSFAAYDVYYLSTYVKGLNLHGDGEPLLFYYESHDLKAMNVAMKRDIADDAHFKNKIEPQTYFDLSTPYGYGGFVYEGEFDEAALSDLNQKYTSYCLSKRLVSEIVRFRPFETYSTLNQNMYNILTLGKTVTIDLASPLSVWQNLASSKRRVIRKADKHGLEIYWGRSPQNLADFIPLYQATMEKDKASSYYFFDHKFYANILNDLKYNMLFFYAVYDQQVISSAMILFANKCMHYHLSGSNVAYNYLSPTSSIMYEAACWGSENGYEKFHLGGGLGSKEDELYRFKKNFNKHSDTSFSIGRKIFNQESYQYLIDIRGIEKETELQSTYFPVYRT